MNRRLPLLILPTHTQTRLRHPLQNRIHAIQQGMTHQAWKSLLMILVVQALKRQLIQVSRLQIESEIIL